MNKLSKEKRNQLVLVVMATLLIIAGLWFLLIRFEQSKLHEVSIRISDAEEKLNKMNKAVGESGKLEAELRAATERLSIVEEGMASGDLYSWIIETVKRFKLDHNVDIPQFTPAVTGEVNLFPRFPYQQATLGVAGAAYYHDFGKFLAEFENRFPCIRVLNLELEPVAAVTPAEKEKLAFRMELAVLVKRSSQ